MDILERTCVLNKVLPSDIPETTQLSSFPVTIRCYSKLYFSFYIYESLNIFPF